MTKPIQIDKVHSTFVNTGKAFCQLMTIMESQAEILALLKHTSKDEELVKIKARWMEITTKKQNS